MSKTKAHNADSVDFGELKLDTTLDTGFDGKAPDEHKRTVQLHFTGFDDLTEDMKSKMLEELAGKLRIKVNSVRGPLKGQAVDYETYAEFLDENDCEFTFNVANLYAPSGRSKTAREKYLDSIREMYENGQFTKQQYEDAKELAPPAE